eukprot:TRINITY_DN8238_c1_g2_i1.p1 TRINITY_DN8238_c1_g2~~TRINITY_DN8238_c1_g2_i1.p1  ORF type:complete len:470 (+),score=29.71 TRINITY_DN8238_c1_g2_i1:68-1411(+)
MMDKRVQQAAAAAANVASSPPVLTNVQGRGQYLSSALLSAAPLLPAAGQNTLVVPTSEKPGCGCDAVAKVAVAGCPGYAENIHVFDPVNKRAYTLLYDPMSRHADVIPTAGLATYFKARETCTSKRFFLCKQYQNSKCRAYHNCNSIHACRAKVTSLRQQHPPTRQALEADILLPLISEEPEGGSFTVPMDRTERTTGRDILLSNLRSGAVGKLCPGYDLKPATCTDPNCPMIHVDSNHMKHVRGMWKVPCCSDPACIGEHAASQVVFPKIGPHTIQGFTFTEPHRGVAGAKVYWPKEALGVTKGLKELDFSAVEYREQGLYVRFQPGKLCRPHQRRACKWGSECNNLHVCRAKVSAEALGLAPWSASASSSEFSTPTSSPNASPRGGHTRHASIWSEASSTSPSGSPRHTHQVVEHPVAEGTVNITPLLNSFRNFQLPTGGMNGFK